MSTQESAKPTRVLFIEDDADIAQLVCRRLSSYTGTRMEVAHFYDLKSGLTALAGTDYDVVLTDLNLPDSQGLQTVRQVLAVRRYVPVVVFSSVDEDEAILDVVESGAQEYLVKGQSDSHTIARTLRQAIMRKQAELRLRRMAHYDSLTGLANRSQFRRRLEHALARAAKNSGSVALMMIDLDRFKSVNDTLGHLAGDRLLAVVAKRLRSCLQESDKIARLGGDEFTVILESLRSLDETAATARKIIEAISRPFVAGGQEVYITPSIGITVYPCDGNNAESLMKNADAAMYEVKASGRNGYRFFAPSMNETTGERLRTESGLRQAVDKRELVLYYQPKVHLQTGRLQGIEALVRWQRPDGKLVQPADFIPVAEDSGLITPIGEWVFRKALAQVRVWLDNGLQAPRVAVNISPRQFRQFDLAGLIADALNRAKLGGEYLEVEITEGVLMEDTQASASALQRLKSLGVRIAIDDFGTGHSSLHYLKRFPIDTLKIDRSFVADIPRDHDDATITKAIIGLAHNLRLTVIAEGVETREQVNFLQENGCDEAQGFLFSVPLNTMQLTAYLQRERNRAASPQFKLVDKGNQLAG